MHRKLIAMMAGVIFPLFAGSACAMTSADSSRVACTVHGEAKFVESAGGKDRICSAIRRAAAAKIPGTKFSADVRVRGSSLISAVVTTSAGRKLPEITTAVSDGTINENVVRRFAEAIVEILASSKRAK